MIFGFAMLLAPLGGAAQEPALVDRISSARLDLERLDDARREVISQRDALDAKLQRLAAEIRRRKEAREKARLLPDYGLDRDLRESQRLSGALTLLHRELAALDRARTTKLEALVSLYDQLIEQTRSQVAGRQDRAGLGMLQRLQRERQALRKQLAPAPTTGSLDLRDMLASEDPEELGERCDAVRDEQDRLRKRLAALDQRLVELESERRLEREMHDFIADQELFSEQSRVLVVPGRESAGTGITPPSDEGKTTNDHGGECPSSMCGTPDEGRPGDWGDQDGDIGYEGADPSAVSGAGIDRDLSSSSPTHGLSEDRVPVGVDSQHDEAADLPAQKRIERLQQQRKQIVEKLKKLQQLNDRLQERIEELANES